MGKLSELLGVVFPPSCVACAKVLRVHAYFCADCERELQRTPSIRCARCSEPGRFDGGECPRCTAWRPSFSVAFAPFAHEGPVARAIHQLKYEDHPELASPLAALLCAEARDFLAAAPPTLCAIALHQRRFRDRGYDQAMLLAAELARLTGRTLADEALRRARETRRQVGLSDDQRERNVAGAFEAHPSCAGQRVLLIDDVFTTGATARAAASALLRAGAREVQVLTLARANRELG
ncbi:MAG: ComF family protein [Myxococcota bacterium]